uniref:AAA ATPase domain-containing protein n=1 Tax=Candidatus Kentrum sp. LPFa TaxID=2126335 RepID=A0A450X469_9GAMM|nr:MAG: AAA ATPase domain-containing protein [Candidatus Kentron sp. LPFa]VFK24087.1 MAG: AAA ATPase domain-containing protein [Candidatus Kentron sp. LPFa]
MTPMNTETNNAIAPRSAWEMIGSFAAIAMLGAAFHRIVPSLIFLLPVFLALSLLVGAYAFGLAVRERNKLPAIVSTVATIAVACYLVRELWGCCPVSWLDVTTAIIALAILSVLAARLLWVGLSPPPDRPDWHLADAPQPLSRKRFVGRLEELGKLDGAWASAVSGEIRTVGIIARGGFGKTTLVRYWLWWRFEKRERFPLFRRLFRPSSGQGSRKPASRNGEDAPRVLLWHTFQEGQGEDGFVAALFRHLAPSPEDPLQDNARRVEALAEAIGGRAYLLILDGLEMVQTRGTDEGADHLLSPFLQKLLDAHEAGILGQGMESRAGARRSQGMVVFTARHALADPARRAQRLSLALEQDYPLDGHEARGILQDAGVKTSKGADSAELAELLQLGGRHPLTLQLMGRFLARENQGRAAGWRELAGDAFELPQADEAGGEGQAALWRVLLDRPRPERPGTARHADHRLFSGTREAGMAGPPAGPRGGAGGHPPRHPGPGLHARRAAAARLGDERRGVP